MKIRLFNRALNSFSERESLEELDAFQCATQNTRERKAILYLEEKKIHDIIDFLMGNLLLRRPDDPYEYLTRLLDKCALSRDGLVDPPPPFVSR